MSDFFSSPEQLKDAFSLDRYPEYIEFAPFSKKIGFGVLRAYPVMNKYSPPVKKDGTPDTYALIGVKYGPPPGMEKQRRVPISVRVSTHSRYISKHWDYNFSDNDCPTEESVLASKRSHKPIDLSSLDEYYYDHETDTFLDNMGKEIEGIQILNKLYELHLATVDKFKGVVLRWKLSSAHKAAAFCSPISDVFKWLLMIICGRSLEPDDPVRGFWTEYRPEDMKLLKTERIDVFGYKASKNVIVTFCVLILGSYLIAYSMGYSPQLLKGILKNNLLSFAVAVLTISVLDHILPKILFFLVNLMLKLEFRLGSVKLRFK